VSTQASFSYDITANRHKGDECSVAANPSDGVKRVWHMWIRNWVMKQKSGGTLQEAADHFDKGMNAISGRFTELVRDGQMLKLGRRNGCAIYFAVIQTEAKQ
jgi:hypothetical protein